MKILEYMERHGHQELCAWTDSTTGLRAFIAIHNTKLGPALGGLRIWPYKDEDAAITDVLRLSKAMTYKAAVAGLDMGGGKSVIMADPKHDKTEHMFRSFGRFVESLGGRYITTEDVGTNPDDLVFVSQETRHVVGLPKTMGGSGNPSEVTGFGVYQAIRACALAVWGDESIQNRTVAIQGFGNVAQSLSKYLLKAQAKLIVTDLDEERLEKARLLSGVTVVPPKDILTTQCDILAPCALGGTLTAETIPQLNCKIVCGGANNQLAEESDAIRLSQKGILYAPDFVANAGGIINLSKEMGQAYSVSEAMDHAARIFQTTNQVIDQSRADGITTTEAANNIAEVRLTTS